jgi:flavin reductase (DIM6/NTAB) family NADH-FMN oxidoreductase RutF
MTLQPHLDGSDELMPTHEVEPADVRAFHRGFPTGVTVVTAMGPTGPKGLVVNAFASLTLDPLFRAHGFAVNVLACDQLGVARGFARSGGDKFADTAWEPGRLGAPILEGSSGVVEAELERRLQVGTHTIFVGRVVHVRLSERKPLLYWEGQLWQPDNLQALEP